LEKKAGFRNYLSKWFSPFPGGFKMESSIASGIDGCCDNLGFAREKMAGIYAIQIVNN
jgi:hypothetical protein